MLLKSVLLLGLPLALAEYVIPAADGSDGWQDAYQKARGTSEPCTAAHVISFS